MSKHKITDPKIIPPSIFIVPALWGVGIGKIYDLFFIRKKDSCTYIRVPVGIGNTPNDI